VNEVKRLQDCINDLISVLALPAIWTGYQPAQIASTLLDALLRMQRLDLAYMRLSDPIDGAPTDIVRSTSRVDPKAQVQAMARALAGVFIGDSSQPRRMPNPLGEGEVSIVQYRLGLHDEVDTLVAGSRRTDFPTQTEALVLRVAANQVAIWLREARLVIERKRNEEQAERRATERGRQLEAANRELLHETTERSRVEVERSALKEELTAELAAVTRLHQFNTRLLARAELQPLLEEILTATMALQHADFGNVQLYNPDTRALEIVAHRGFRRDFLDYFSRVNEDSAVCGRALHLRERVIVEDVLTDPGFAPHLRIAASAGFRAVQSTPLFGRNGEPLGMLSTHFRRPHRPSLRELSLTDLFARQAAEMIERKQAEKALRESQARLQAILDHSPAMIFLKDLDGRYLLSNRQFEKIARISCEAVVGKMDEELFPPEQAAVHRANDRAVLDADAPLEFEQVSPQVDGLHTSIVFKFPLRNADGKTYALGGIASDITERKQAEETQRNLEQELAHVARVMSMGELTASIAHEINQPLAAIVTNGAAALSWLARAVPNLEEARGAVERIVRDGKHAGDVIRRIRALSGKRPPQRNWLDINDVIREVLTVTQNEMGRLEVVLRTDLSTSIPKVLGDHIELQQVVLNLMINGIDAMKSVSDRPRSLRIGSHSSTSTEMTVAVRDSGIGLDPRALDRLFDAFFTTKPGGLGLGLSISRRIIEAHGGRLWATPNDDYGLTMTFTLPTSVGPMS
jgi:PAS domain S-box-containing protein